MVDSKKSLEDEASASYEMAQARFEKNSEIGEQFFFVKTWPSWFVSGSEKWYSPVIRLYVGDRHGNVLIGKPVVLSSLIDLIGEMTSNVAGDISIASELSGFKMFLPVSKEDLLNGIENIIQNAHRMKEKIKEIEITDDIESREAAD